MSFSISDKKNHFYLVFLVFFCFCIIFLSIKKGVIVLTPFIFYKL
ncbi:hypothetical protein ANASTE_00946 [Anaerofustis stercorihominis DSM 17244]|uniref:Uncharacterized protein n=1 Tax=Anaerofustis stercorihominis DSM 17244 TaxID=445971 RepID=B1C888_9FIRM|nr:hypothetical protein ANASTE_00946 [Anaerofustis stercorihominis DSM 17244]